MTMKQTEDVYKRQALMTHPAVVECAITGVPDEIRGQEMCIRDRYSSL